MTGLTSDEQALNEELTRRTNADEITWEYHPSSWASAPSRQGRCDSVGPRPKPSWRAGDSLLLWTQPGVEDFRRPDEAAMSRLEVNGKDVRLDPALYWAIWAQHDRMRKRRRDGDCAEAMKELGVEPLPEWRRVARRARRLRRAMNLLKFLFTS